MLHGLQSYKPLNSTPSVCDKWIVGIRSQNRIHQKKCEKKLKKRCKGMAIYNALWFYVKEMFILSHDSFRECATYHHFFLNIYREIGFLNSRLAIKRKLEKSDQQHFGQLLDSGKSSRGCFFSWSKGRNDSS